MTPTHLELLRECKEKLETYKWVLEHQTLDKVPEAFRNDYLNSLSGLIAKLEKVK